MKSSLPLILAFSATVCSFAIAQDATYEAPKTEYGHPDLQGVWNFSSSTPMQRPTQFARSGISDREEVGQHCTARSTAVQLQMQLRQTCREPEAPSATDDPGGYNDFWFEMANIGDTVRTSHIVYPLDGRIPPAVEGAQRQFGGLGPDIPSTRPVRFVVGGIAKDGPEDRGTSERCLVGFNSGPPFTPSLYNNNVQIFQNKDTRSS